MKKASFFSENGDFISLISVDEYENLTDEEKERVKCGHINPETGEQCFGSVCPCVRIGKKGKPIDYFCSPNHIPGCEAAVVSKTIRIAEKYDTDGNGINFTQLFEEFTNENISSRPSEKPLTGGDDGKKIEEEEKEPPEMEQIVEKEKRKPDFKATTSILRQKLINESYADIPDFDLIIDEYTLTEHRIGSLLGKKIVIAYPRKKFYDSAKSEIYLKVFSAINDNRWANFTLRIKKERMFYALISSEFDENHIFLNRPIAFVGELINTSPDGKYDDYNVEILNTKAAFIVTDSILEHHHEGF